MQLSPLFPLQHATLPSFCHGPMANSQLVFIWKHQKQPIPDRLPQCMPALAKARLYKMTGPDPSMNHKMVFRLGPLHEAHFMVHGRVRPCHFIVERLFFCEFLQSVWGPLFSNHSAPGELGLSNCSPPGGWTPPLCIIK